MACHNSEQKAGGIDLSTRGRAAAAGLLRPGQENRLIQAVAGGKMPPVGGALSRAEVDELRRWIESGAPYPAAPLIASSTVEKPLWSFQPVAKVVAPRTSFDKLARNTVDRFLFEKIQKAGLKPSPPASPRELLRRVTFDLTGLPPTPEEQAAFEADRSDGAYRRVVDRLLASPAYGERWGRHWLDVARYGDSHGYEQNHLRPNAWPYRDYVIRFFNEDRPYTEFITEQLAGDVIAAGDPDREVGTGFLVAGVHDTVGNQSEEGKRQQRVNDLDDIVSAASEAFMGLTAGCARCHDHKFDPIPQRDYYRLAAVFAGFQHGEREIEPPSQVEAAIARRRELAGKLRSAELDLALIDEAGRQAHLKSQGVASPPRPAVDPRLNWDDFEPVRARFVRFTIEATGGGAEPCLDELEIYGADPDRNLALEGRATASSLLPGYPIHQIAHLNDGRLGNRHSWISREPGRGWAQVELPAGEVVQRVVWSRDGGAAPRLTDRTPSRYRIEVSLDGSEWSEAASHEGRAPAREAISADLLKAALAPDELARRKEIETGRKELQEQLDKLAAGRKAYVGTVTAPEPTYLLRRGDVMQRDALVEPGALSLIPQLPGDFAPSEAAGALTSGERRLALARWLTDRRNPLTARVLVNRIWQHHFGRGIVDTSSDFGRNGAAPSHPELLDWLAADFMNNGWRIKRLHRMLVTSYAYRQTARSTPSGERIDAGNQLLWRMPLRRLEGEALRDAVLQVSGKLSREAGGPGYRLYDYKVVNVAIYGPLEEHGPETWRRSVYRQAARGIREELLGSFDCPESSQRTPRRVYTTTPLQALALLNGEFIQQQSGFFAERLSREAGADRMAQAVRAFQLALGRPPDPQEKQAAAELIASHGAPALARALFNTNEFLYY